MKNQNILIFFISNSPWPIVFSFSLFFFRLNLICFLSSKINIFFLLNLILLFFISYFWWNDVIIESTYNGFHNLYVINITIYSIVFFIISEIFFFIRFFWSFFHSIFSPDIFIGSLWPYQGIFSINYLNLPLLNSIILISRRCSISWSHYLIILNKLNNSKNVLIITIFLGLIFISCQIFEYYFSYFSFSDGIFGSIFFIRTGFHGLHVIIGTLFIISILIRIRKNHFSNNHILGYEFCIWYWHFVDVVWLYLYLIIYWLGR